MPPPPPNRPSLNPPLQSPPPPPPFLSVYFFSVSFCPCLPGPLGLDNLPPTSPPCSMTAGTPNSYGYSNQMGYQISDFRLLWTITPNPPPPPPPQHPF